MNSEERENDINPNKNEVELNENDTPSTSSVNLNKDGELDENLNEITAIIKPTEQRKWMKCDLCNVPLSSSNSIQRHVTGKRHLANIRKLNEKHSEDKKKLFCEICKVKSNSIKQLEDHLRSNKHRGKLEMIERKKQLKHNCLFGILIASFIFAILINIFYAMFSYIQSL